MNTVRKVQTAFRLPEDLIERLKRKARGRDMSLNAYVERLLLKDAPAELEFPKMDPNEPILPSVMALGRHSGEPLKFKPEELKDDPRLDYLAHKYGLVDE